MTEFPAVHDPGSIELLLTHIRTKDPPPRIDEDYLVEAGFRRETDESLEQLMEFLGVMDPGGAPTELWKALKHKGKGPKLLAESIKAGYWKLFKQVPDANTADGGPLMEFFKKETDASDQDAAYMILTFKVLCDLAHFEDQEEEQAPSKGAAEPAKEEKTEPPAAEETSAASTGGSKALEEMFEGERESRSGDSAPAPVSGSGGVRLTIELQLDGTTDKEIRDLLLKLLRKRLEED